MSLTYAIHVVINATDIAPPAILNKSIKGVLSINPNPSWLRP